MARKNRRDQQEDAPPAETVAADQSDVAQDEAGTVYDIDIDPGDIDMDALQAEMDEVAAAMEEPEKTADAADSPAMRKIGRQEVLARLLEKNEVILKLTTENVAQQKKLGEFNDKWLRSVAEFENYRKRSRKEWELLKQQSKAEVILEILNILDDFERAFTVVEGAESDEFQEGIRLIYNNLQQVLSRFGVEEFESQEKPFDPNYHMAIGQAESDSVSSDHVVEVVQKGYRMEDTVIRPARVIVAK